MTGIKWAIAYTVRNRSRAAPTAARENFSSIRFRAEEPNGAGKSESHANIVNRGFGPLQITCGMTDGEGAPKYGLHALRHAAASLFIDQGMNPKRVQTIMGTPTSRSPSTPTATCSGTTSPTRRQWSRCKPACWL